MLSIAVIQEDSWDALKCTELSQDSSFFAWAEVYIDGERLTTVGPGCDRRKLAAKHRACWLWLCGFVRGELVGVEAREVPEKSVAIEGETAVVPKVDVRSQKLQVILEKPLVDGQNHVGTLLEICQLMGWPSPSFVFEERSGGFYCRCTAEYFGEVVVGDAIAQRKKLAKQRAALDILKTLI
ncbi:hypothetical protein C1752_08435 [Acaryochloris thomasi RCC1774]|uniref:DRBM domain-containing protein n=1 Tax=Acaryochloris thomasi RCC1774 TaxID=1764569 RepID=A0A2W1J9R0_9CYAN|nr:hypothetical protein C1752_08435 [Acaryochloris thomasi RCC1774]